MISCFFVILFAYHRGTCFDHQVAFQLFDQIPIINNHEYKPFSGDSPIESSLTQKAYIPYLVIIHIKYQNIIIVWIIMRYNILKYGIIIIRKLINSHQKWSKILLMNKSCDKKPEK